MHHCVIWLCLSLAPSCEFHVGWYGDRCGKFSFSHVPICLGSRSGKEKLSVNLLWVGPRLFLEWGCTKKWKKWLQPLLVCFFSSRYLRKPQVTSGECASLPLSPITSPYYPRTNALLEVLKWSEELSSSYLFFDKKKHKKSTLKLDKLFAFSVIIATFRLEYEDDYEYEFFACSEI